MTHDEIMALDACGLRLEVARVKGFSYRDESGMPNIMPDWPRDIAAAWELFLELPLPRRIHQDDGSIYVFCGGYSYGPTTDMEYDFYVEVDEEETPNAFCVAICRIRLMWKQT